MPKSQIAQVVDRLRETADLLENLDKCNALVLPIKLSTSGSADAPAGPQPTWRKRGGRKPKAEKPVKPEKPPKPADDLDALPPPEAAKELG